MDGDQLGQRRDLQQPQHRGILGHERESRAGLLRPTRLADEHADTGGVDERHPIQIEHERARRLHALLEQPFQLGRRREVELTRDADDVPACGQWLEPYVKIVRSRHAGRV